MRNYKTTPVVYEYRYDGLSADTRNCIMSKRHSLFERSSRKHRKVNSSSVKDTLIAKLGTIAAIASIIAITSYIF